MGAKHPMYRDMESCLGGFLIFTSHSIVHVYTAIIAKSRLSGTEPSTKAKCQEMLLLEITKIVLLSVSRIVGKS